MTDKDDGVRREPIQMAIDPETGRDITAEVIATRLRELRLFADTQIEQAVRRASTGEESRKKLFREYHALFHERIGTGSIGPATAAAGPLLEEKQRELASKLAIDYERFLEEEHLW